MLGGKAVAAKTANSEHLVVEQTFFHRRIVIHNFFHFYCIRVKIAMPAKSCC